MTITLELSPEQETRLRKKAAQRDIEAVRRVLAEAMEPTIEALLEERSDGMTDEEFEACANELADEWEAASDPGALPLPDEALTREGIYGEHP